MSVSAPAHILVSGRARRQVTVKLSNVPGGLENPLESTVTFTVTVEPPLRPRPPAAPVAKGGAVERKEIRSMSPVEQLRYVEAIKKMMEDTDGPESSPFFRLAGYHGWPGNGSDRNYSYCTHRQETFPCWHRAYLCDF